MKVIRKMVKHLITQQPEGAVHFWVVCLRMITSYTAPSIQLLSQLFRGMYRFLRSALLCQTILLSSYQYLFLSKGFDPKYHLFKWALLCRTALISSW